jgi:hypothetical protein
MHFRLFPLLAFLGAGLAQRPADTSICDYYTTALLKDNNAIDQVALLVFVVNTAVIGNYSEVNVGVKVPSILTPGFVMERKSTSCRSLVVVLLRSTTAPVALAWCKTSSMMGAQHRWWRTWL